MTIKGLKTIVAVITAFAIILLITLIAVNVVISVKISNEKNTQQRLQEELATLEGQRENLEAEIEYRKTQEYIEQYARENLGLSNPDDVIYKPNK